MSEIADTLSVAEAAALLGCSGQTVRERIKRGELAGFVVRTKTGKQWRLYRTGALALAGVSEAVEIIPEICTDATPPQPGVLEALALLRDSLAREESLRAENARLRAQLAAPLALAAPAALGWWAVLWQQLGRELALGRTG